MANRFVLNTISYHGSGAIKEIPGELQRRGSYIGARLLYVP